METVELVIAIIGVVIPMVGALWYLASQISELKTRIHAHKGVLTYLNTIPERMSAIEARMKDHQRNHEHDHHRSRNDDDYEEE